MFLVFRVRIEITSRATVLGVITTLAIILYYHQSSNNFLVGPRYLNSSERNEIGNPDQVALLNEGLIFFIPSLRARRGNFVGEKMKNFYSSTLLGVILMSILSGVVVGQEKPSVAVLPLDGYGISKGAALTLTEKLRAELFETQLYRVVERQKMLEILSEQGFQQSGCTSTECLVEAGMLLGAQKMVGGSIGKVGRAFSVSLRLIDVEKGLVEGSCSEDYFCPIEELLLKVGECLAELIAPTPKPRPILQVASLPPSPPKLSPQKHRRRPSPKKTRSVWAHLGQLCNPGHNQNQLAYGIGYAESKSAPLKIDTKMRLVFIKGLGNTHIIRISVGPLEYGIAPSLGSTKLWCVDVPRMTMRGVVLNGHFDGPRGQALLRARAGWMRPESNGEFQTWDPDYLQGGSSEPNEVDLKGYYFGFSWEMPLSPRWRMGFEELSLQGDLAGNLVRLRAVHYNQCVLLLRNNSLIR